MKKLIFILIGLMICGTAHAGLIDITVLSSDSQVSYSYFNTAFNTIKNEINGALDDANIEDGTITIDDMATAASPAQREGDHFNAYTKSGHLPATDTDLSSDISAGVSYVKSDAGLMYRISTDATSKTYTASKNTWTYIDSNGAFQYVEVAVDAAQPTTPANSLLLAKVVTDADNITSVSDERTLSISLGVNDDFHISGMKLLYTATDRLSVDCGICYNGSTRLAKVDTTGLNVGTAGNYINGSSERGTNKDIYVYIDDSGSIKLDDDDPDYHDTSGTTTGTKHYFLNGSDYWRFLGQVHLDGTGSGNVIPFDMTGENNTVTVMYTTPPHITGTVPASATWTTLSCDNLVPPTSTLGIFGLAVGNGGGNSVSLFIRPKDTSWTLDTGSSIGGTSNSSIAGPDTASQRHCATDEDQEIEYYLDTSPAGSEWVSINMEGYVYNR